MLQSIIVYTGTALLLYLLATNLVRRENYVLQTESRTLSIFSWEIIFSIILFAFISGVRYNVGVDHLSYLGDYLTAYNGQESLIRIKEWGFYNIMFLFTRTGLHFTLFFAFWAAVQIGLIYYAFRNNKQILPYIALCIMLGPYYLDWMNGIRQCVVECMFVWGIEFVHKRNFGKFLLLLILASGIHKSVLILLPIYFLLNAKFDLNNIKLNLGILFICVLLGNVPSWLSVFNSFDGLLQNLGYEKYAQDIKIMTTENLRETAWGPGRLSLFMIDLVIIYLYPSIKRFFYHDKEIIRMYFILFFIGTCLYQLFVNTSHIFLRPIEYLLIFRLVMSAYVLLYLRNLKLRPQFYLFLLIACANIYISLVKISQSPMSSDFIAYKFFWDYIN